MSIMPPDPDGNPAARDVRRAEHRRINQRPKRCPQCADVVQAGNLARHVRRHVREYA